LNLRSWWFLWCLQWPPILSLQMKLFLYQRNCQSWLLNNIFWISICSWNMTMLLSCIVSSCEIVSRVHCVCKDHALFIIFCIILFWFYHARMHSFMHDDRLRACPSYLLGLLYDCKVMNVLKWLCAIRFRVSAFGGYIKGPSPSLSFNFSRIPLYESCLHSSLGFSRCSWWLLHGHHLHTPSLLLCNLFQF
jgi:hypothetical protein